MQRPPEEGLAKQGHLQSLQGEKGEWLGLTWSSPEARLTMLTCCGLGVAGGEALLVGQLTTNPTRAADRPSGPVEGNRRHLCPEEACTPAWRHQTMKSSGSRSVQLIKDLKMHHSRAPPAPVHS